MTSDHSESVGDVAPAPAPVAAAAAAGPTIERAPTGARLTGPRRPRVAAAAPARTGTRKGAAGAPAKAAAAAPPWSGAAAGVEATDAGALWVGERAADGDRAMAVGLHH